MRSAKGGSFAITFERDNQLQLLRIALPGAAGIYPEISGSHHRCSVRFLTWNGLTTAPHSVDSGCAVHCSAVCT